MTTRGFALAGLALLFLAGCASAPSPDELATADYGAPIAQDDAERAASTLLHSCLKDPSSALIDWAPVAPGWIREAPVHGGGRRYGYLLNARIDAKHRFGGYAGYKPFMFLFRDGQLVSAYAGQRYVNLTMMRKIR